MRATMSSLGDDVAPGGRADGAARAMVIYSTVAAAAAAAAAAEVTKRILPLLPSLFSPFVN